MFPPGGVRVRAIPCEDYCIADGSIERCRIRARHPEDRRRAQRCRQAATCAGLFDIMKAHFAAQFAEQGLALSLELNEFSESGTLKHNNLHARLKKIAAAQREVPMLSH